MQAALLTPEMRAQIEAYFPRYPTKQAVTLPTLHIINEKLRCVPKAIIPELARLLELAPAEVWDTLSFYGFFPEKPCGTVRAWVCRSIACALRGGEEVLSSLGRELDVHPGQNTADGKVTLEYAECLGLCDFAPAMLANEKTYKNLAPENAAGIAAELRAQADAGG